VQGDWTVPLLQSADVTLAVERVLAVAFGNKLRWFESHYQHISLSIRMIENIY
jgi:hypothetical protein